MSTLERVERQKQIVETIEQAYEQLKSNLEQYQQLTHVQHLPEPMRNALDNLKLQMIGEQTILRREQARYQSHQAR